MALVPAIWALMIDLSEPSNMGHMWLRTVRWMLNSTVQMPAKRNTFFGVVAGLRTNRSAMARTMMKSGVTMFEEHFQKSRGGFSMVCNRTLIAKSRRNESG